MGEEGVLKLEESRGTEKERYICVTGDSADSLGRLRPFTLLGIGNLTDVALRASTLFVEAAAQKLQEIGECLANRLY